MTTSDQTQSTPPPIKLLTVNTAPERAKLVIGRVAQQLSDRYDLEHVGNCERIEDVASAVTTHQPDVLFTASMWTPTQATQIHDLARSLSPALVTFAIPEGLQVERGPDGVVEFLVERVPAVLDAVPAR